MFAQRQAIAIPLAAMAALLALKVQAIEAPIVCQIENKEMPLTLNLNRKKVVIENPGKLKVFEAKILKKTIRGRGALARTAYVFREGNISFQSIYGCLENVRWEWKSKTSKNPINTEKIILCKSQDNLPCAK